MRGTTVGTWMGALACGALVVACSSSSSDDSGSNGAGTGGSGGSVGAGGSGTGGTGTGGSGTGGTGTGGTGTGGTGGTGTGGTGGTGTGGTGGAGTGGKATGGTGTGGAGTGGSAATKGGNVIVTDSSFKAAGMTFSNYSAFAGFSDGAATSGATCTTSMSGACTVVSCNLGGTGGTGGAGGGPSKSPSAGDIHIDGGVETVELHADANGTYATVTAMKQLFQGGETLTVGAAGADVPMFTGMVTAPGTPILSKPTLPSLGTPLAIDRTMDFQIAWTGVTHGAVQLFLTSSSATMSSVAVCEFDGASGSGTIAAADLAKLVPGTGSFAVEGSEHAVVMAGDYAVRIAAQSNGTDANGASAAGQTMIK